MREHGYAVGKIELKENKGSLLFWPREARLQGGQRSLVPDFSLNLTDAQHTEPKNVKLLRPYSGNSHKNALNPPLTKGEQLTVPEVKNADSSIDIAIITIIEEEYLAVKQHLHNTCSIQGTATNPNTHAWVSGEIDAPHLSIPYKVILAMAGEAGNNSGAIATNRTIERWKPRYVLLVGIAGGLPREGLVKGDVVLSSIIWDYEYGKIDNGFKPRMDFTYRVDGPLLRSGKIFSRDKNWNWRDKIIASPPEPEHTPKVITGPIASGNKVVDNITDEFFERVLEAWPKIQAVEMEGAGAAFAIEAAKEEGRAIGFFMVRGISDMPENSTAANRETDSSQTEERDSWKEYAADAAASFALGWVQSEYWPVQPRAAQAAPSPQQTNERIEQPGATQAEPSPQQTDEGIEQPEMPGKEDQIIEELLVCPSMETTEGSAAVLGKLPRHIRQAIARSTYPRILGLNMVTTCLNYPDGMQALLDAVRFFDKGTKEFIRFEEIVSETGMQ
ncbi:MAG: 5'-methylthioadenosine/S-adenosylhomocysteine nucleosidase [Gammaproteobacteria bacterium]|nr:5'-methylthioadenosine/S-adenosylhomocysteine nucleosidase [Gammaproteobacteria bacterium]